MSLKHQIKSFILSLNVFDIYNTWIVLCIKKKAEDTKKVIRSRDSKEDRQYNDQQTKGNQKLQL
jgi:hypothetical protein